MGERVVDREKDRVRQYFKVFLPYIIYGGYDMEKQDRILYLKEAVKKLEKVKFTESTRLMIDALKETIKELEENE